ncbi:ABC transporter substrate-binding protein [Mycobacterium sp. URHB0021]|jgi:sulfonate transport system substrate-binding protein
MTIPIGAKLRLKATALIVGTALIVAGCGKDSEAAGPTSAPTGPLVPAPTLQQAEANPLSPYPSQPGNLPKVAVGQSIPALSFAALDIAQEMNFFGFLGVDVDYQQLQAGSTMLQAVSSGSINIGDSASTEIATAAVKGLPLQAIQNTIMMTLQVCVRKAWAQSHGVTPSSPLADRVEALKGAKIAITGPGSVSDTIARWLLKKYTQLDANNDVSLIQVGGAASFAPSLDSDRVQAFILSAPNCQQAKEGEVLIQPTEIETFRNYTHEVLYVRSDWAKKNSDIATRVATAVAMGNNFILKHPTQALEVLQKKYPQVPPSVVAKAFGDNILPNIRGDGKFSEEMWASTGQVLQEGGFIPKPLDVTEGAIWTNNYINVESAKVY